MNQMAMSVAGVRYSICIGFFTTLNEILESRNFTLSLQKIYTLILQKILPSVSLLKTPSVIMKKHPQKFSKKVPSAKRLIYPQKSLELLPSAFNGNNT